MPNSINKRNRRKRLAAIKFKLRDSTNLNETVEELTQDNPDLYDYIIDLYIRYAERAAGTRKQNNKKYRYDVSYSRNKSQKEIIEKLEKAYFIYEGVVPNEEFS